MIYGRRSIGNPTEWRNRDRPLACDEPGALRDGLLVVVVGRIRSRPSTARGLKTVASVPPGIADNTRNAVEGVAAV